jgi:pyruvate dehydrogenase E2 component (dihydrolipoamide acetyltransferase)
VATNILMPALSPTMTEGTLARWLKKEGDPIKAGDAIAEIETDKATMEVEAVDEGVLGRILVQDGTEGVKVNDPIAVLVDRGEAVPAAGNAPAKVEPPGGPLPDGTGAPAKVAPPAPAAGRMPAAAAPASHANGAAAAPFQKSAPNGERIFASPLARRMASQAGIDLSALKGSGPNGRIVRADIEAARQGTPAQTPEVVAQAAAAAAPVVATAPVARAPSPATAIAAPHRVVPHSSMRKIIARRLTEAKSTIPHFYISMDIELDAMIAIQEQLNARSPARDQPGSYFITINDVVIKAAATTLRRIPEVNASWTDDGMVFYDDVDISVAVAIPDGLITPIVRKADQKGLLTISREMRDLATRARAGKLKPDEFQGGGFSISNMGMFGVTEFSAIINPPQAAILAVATGAKRPVVKNGALAVATVMTCTISVDHRVVDGALGARWLREFKSILEDPLRLML